MQELLPSLSLLRSLLSCSLKIEIPFVSLLSDSPTNGERAAYSLPAAGFPALRMEEAAAKMRAAL